MLKLDEWQREVLEYQGNIALRSGRQVGKSTVISIKAAEYAVRNPNKTILIISSVERQAYFLFSKTLSYLIDKYKPEIKRGKDQPTKTRLKLRNGSIIYSLPTGLDGHGIRGLTVDLLIADEAAFIPELVWTAVTPMMSATRGKVILLSTPHGRDGYFYRCFEDSNFKTWHISSEDCPRIDKAYLERERENMTAAQYAAEYLGEFVDELIQFFPTEIIQQCMVLEQRIPKDSRKYLGIDVARRGGDETVFVGLEKTNEGLYMFSLDIYVQTLITDTIRLTKDIDRKYRFKKIYIDDGGLGVGVYDSLREDDTIKRRIIAVNNARRAADYETSIKPTFKERKTRLMKEALYANLLKLMELKKIHLLQSPELFLSLRSVQYEIDPVTKVMRIFGNYTHIAEALIRAAWCIKDKTLNIWTI